MNTTKLNSLVTGKEIATIDTVCLVDIRKVIASSADAYHVLELHKADLEKLADATCGPEVVENLVAALGDAESVTLGYQTLKPESKWTITGRITNRKNAPEVGLCILAYDKDTAKADDFLGCAFTDDEGRFELHYDESDFKSEKALIDFEGNPDIYLDISDVNRKLSKRTSVKGEADKDEHFEVKIDFDSETKTLRPVVGYFFIEEDRLEEEIDDLKEAIKNDPDDAVSHFYLGLCFIEMMKAVFKKAEWMLPEMRLEDDVLAVAAMKELDEVIALDDELAEDAKRYKKFAQELQKLAL